MMDLCKHTGAMQLDKIVMRRAFGRKVLGQLSPLAPGGKYVEYAVDEGAPRNAAFGRKKLLYQRILLVGQIALITQTSALVAPTVLLSPHAPSPRIDAHGGTESQPILMTQENSGRALSIDDDGYFSQGGLLFAIATAPVLLSSVAANITARGWWRVLQAGMLATAIILMALSCWQSFSFMTDQTMGKVKLSEMKAKNAKDIAELENQTAIQERKELREMAI